MIGLVATLVGATLGSAILTNVTRNALRRRGVMDLPSERGLHARPVVRGAGLAFAITWLVVAVIIAVGDGGRTAGLPALILMAAGLAAIGLWDDLRHSNPFFRLLAQIVICGGAVLGGLSTTTIGIPGNRSVELGIWAVPLCLLGLLAMVNVFNFMDGIDGLTASQTIVAAAAVVGAAAMAGHTILGLLAAALAAGLAGFLPFNWSPARCFMGDAGSYFCGGVLGGLLLLSESQGIPLIVVGLASAAFVLDGLVTLLRRLVCGKPIWQPHRDHLYQRLVLRGWPHAAVAALYVAVALALGGAGLGYLAGGHLKT